jgi:predicted dithiol-disulfide oxidoreductase (DUF899 family)
MMLENNQAIEDKIKQIDALRAEINELRAAQAAMPVQDYELARPDGSPVKLSELFGERDQLFLIHNMGFACPYCTLWADGFNGVWRYLDKRAAVVLMSNDRPDQQLAGAQQRGWSLPMASARGTSLFADMGFAEKNDKDEWMWWPGVSTLSKDAAGNMQRHSAAVFGPGDDYCAIWHLFPLLKNNDENIEPTQGM